jgi:hypothetical protein
MTILYLFYRKSGFHYFDIMPLKIRLLDFILFFRDYNPLTRITYGACALIILRVHNGEMVWAFKLDIDKTLRPMKLT